MQRAQFCSSDTSRPNRPAFARLPGLDHTASLPDAPPPSARPRLQQALRPCGPLEHQTGGSRCSWSKPSIMRSDRTVRSRHDPPGLHAMSWLLGSDACRGFCRQRRDADGDDAAKAGATQRRPSPPLRRSGIDPNAHAMTRRTRPATDRGVRLRMAPASLGRYDRVVQSDNGASREFTSRFPGAQLGCVTTPDVRGKSWCGRP